MLNSFFAFNFEPPLSSEMVLEELINRKGRSGVIPLDPDFEIQNKVRADRSQFKALKCTRRSGKSTTEVLDHIDKCTEFPNSRTLYMALTLDSASEICWDIFKEYNEKHNLNLRFNESKKIIHYPNGSRTRLFGLDSNEKQITRVLGQKLRKVSIDEAGSLTRNMRKIIYQMILPTLADLSPNSWLTLLGTCENIPNTFFQEVTEGKETTIPWKVYEWTAYDNPYMKAQWSKLIDDMKASNPAVVEASWFKTHYLNMWVTDDNLLIIPASKATIVDALPLQSDWAHILGVDLGFNDESAFSIVSYSFTHKKAYVSLSFGESGMDFTEVSDTIKKLKKDFAISRIVVDGANKQGVEEMKKRLGLPELEIAEKQGKAVYLKLLKDDVVTGKLCFLKEVCDELLDEWKKLQWKDDKKLLEDPRCSNHCFAEGAKVKTIFGEKDISKIKKGDFVLTRAGYREVLKKHVNIAKETYKIIFSNGKELECTGNHPFFTNRGVIKAENLKVFDVVANVYAWKQKALRSYLTVESTEDIQTRKEEQTGFTTLLMKSRGKDTFTGIFTSIIMAIYLLAFIFTTKMAIPRIIILKILSLFHHPSIQTLTLQMNEGKSLEDAQKLEESLRSSGMGQMKESSGTESTVKRFSIKCLRKRKNLSAFVVRLFLMATKIVQLVFVRQSVTQSYEGTRGLMILKRFAKAAESLLRPINTEKELLAHTPVIVHIEKVTKPKIVYNLSVCGLHEYSVNGFFVANCSDSTLYAWRETFAFAAVEPDPIPDPTKPEYNQYLEKLYMEETQDNQEEFAYGTSETYSDW